MGAFYRRMINNVFCYFWWNIYLCDMKRLILASIALILLLPLIFMGPRDELILSTYLLKCALPCAMLLVLWVNYLLVFPSYDKHESKQKVIIQNVLLVIVCSVFLAITHSMEFDMRASLPRHNEFEQTHASHDIHAHHGHHPHKKFHLDNKFNPHKKPHRDKPNHFVIYTGLRDCFTLTLVIFVAYAIHASRRISRLKHEQQEMNAARQEAELRGLRHQLSPHFLLNTLNNIYSLSILDSNKASEAVMELSNLLRHTLYESQDEMVSLVSEAKFLMSYIELMRLRLASNVQVNQRILIAEDSETKVAPLLFISLLENAFKHGVAPAQNCNIDILLEEDDKQIHLHITNSLHPKTTDDRSGHGIGLQSVETRLNYYYPNLHTWNYGAHNNEWITDLSLAKS